MSDRTSPRRALREKLAGPEPLLAPVCLDPLSARLAERTGFGAAYLSGGGLGFALAVSEALLTTTEVANAARQITQRSSLPLVVDGGVGFGDALHTMRAVWELEAAGAAAIELEDQVAPKRAHHHKGVEHLVPVETMVQKIEAAVEARRDPALVLIARTGAVRNEGFEAALARGQAYLQAGADVLMIFPSSEEEIRRAGSEFDAPLSLMGAAGSWSTDLLQEAGFKLLIDPFTGQVVMYRALREAYQRLHADGESGEPHDELMQDYREIHEVAGLPDFYALEERTTERPDAGA